LAYAQMDNITSFRWACEKLGLKKTVVFSTSDLFEGRNGSRVLDTLQALARHAFSNNLTTIRITEVEESNSLYMQALTDSGFINASDEEAAKVPCAPEHKPLLDWANEKLATAVKPVVLHNFSTDVRSGLKLLTLAECLLKEQCMGHWHDPPTQITECMQNVCLLFSFLEQRKMEEISCCQPQDVVTGNAERVVALVSFMREEFDLEYIFNRIVEGEEAAFEEEGDSQNVVEGSSELEQVIVEEAKPEEEIKSSEESGEVTTQVEEGEGKKKKKKKDKKKKKEKDEKKEHRHRHRKNAESSGEIVAEQKEEEGKEVEKVEEEKEEEEVKQPQQEPKKEEQKDEKPVTLTRQTSSMLLSLSGSMKGASSFMYDKSYIPKHISTQEQQKPEVKQSEEQKQPESEEGKLQKQQGQTSLGSLQHNRSPSSTMKLGQQREAKKKAQIIMRQRIANEVLTTEESYCNSLETLCTKVVQPLKDLSKSWTGGRDSTKPLSESEVDVLFSNAFEIWEDSKAFLEKIRTRLQKWSDETTTLGDLFLEQLPILRHYGRYLADYASASAALHYMTQHHLPTKALIERFELEQFKINRLNVPSFHVMPVQRLPRYVLLMNDLKKYTSPNHPDVQYLTELLPKLQATVSELNKGIDPKKEANMAKTIEVAESISGEGVEDIVRGERLFVREGPIKQMCSVSSKTGKEKASHKGYCFLFNNLIVLCGISTKKDTPYTLLRKIDANSIVNVIFLQKSLSFRLTYRVENSETPSLLSPPGSGSPSPNASPSTPRLPQPAAPAAEETLSTFGALCSIRSQASAAQLLITSKVPTPSNNDAVLKTKKTQKTVIMRVTTPEEYKDWEGDLSEVAKLSRGLGTSSAPSLPLAPGL